MSLYDITNIYAISIPYMQLIITEKILPLVSVVLGEGGMDESLKLSNKQMITILPFPNSQRAQFKVFSRHS